MIGNKVVSLFSGCGGLDLGFQNAGYEIIWANDSNESLKETYEKNHETALDTRDIRDIKSNEIPDCDGVIGGPPCQSWSLAGNHLRGSDDKRGEVFYEYLRVIRDKQPKFFVAENVPGIVSDPNIDEFRRIKRRMENPVENLRYDVRHKMVNSAYYNVPQERKRVIIVGIREDINFEYQFPQANDEKMKQKESELTELPSPKPAQLDSHEREELNVINHEYYVGDYSSRYMSRNRVRAWDEPAYTVEANARHAKIHPKAPKMEKIEKDKWKFSEGHEDEYRRYSVRESAILQTFPMDFEFYYGNIRDGYKMVGNAVPVNLAEAIANSLKQINRVET